jgi:hypothetical protein
MTSAIVTTSAAIEPRDMGELKEMARNAAVSKFYGASTPEQALMLLMTGRDLGLSYSQALRAFHVVSGKPALSSAGMVAVCLRSDLCEYFETVEVSDTAATVRCKRKNRPERVCTFTIEEAKRAKLTGKDVWQAYPSRMLLARAQAFLAREVFPDILLGLYDEDEIPAPTSPPRRVEVQATVVPEATPTPRSAHQEPDWVSILNACTHPEELPAIREQMKASGIRSVKDNPAAVDAYNRAKARCDLLARAAQEQAPAPAPEAPEPEVINEDAEPC